MPALHMPATVVRFSRHLGGELHAVARLIFLNQLVDLLRLSLGCTWRFGTSSVVVFDHYQTGPAFMLWTDTPGTSTLIRGIRNLGSALDAPSDQESYRKRAARKYAVLTTALLMVSIRP